jgi:hypothetical protein
MAKLLRFNVTYSFVTDAASREGEDAESGRRR